MPAAPAAVTGAPLSTRPATGESHPSRSRWVAMLTATQNLRITATRTPTPMNRANGMSTWRCWICFPQNAPRMSRCSAGRGQTRRSGEARFPILEPMCGSPTEWVSPTTSPPVRCITFASTATSTSRATATPTYTWIRLIGAPDSYFVMGTADDPIPADHSAQITILDNGPLPASDGLQLSRGVVLHGNVFVFGAPKDPYLQLASDPGSWGSHTSTAGVLQPGGALETTCWCSATHYDRGASRRGRLKSEDEQRELSSIEGESVSLREPLRYNHDVPGGHSLHSYVANLSRNVRFQSENPNGVRGHFMVMHSDAAIIRNAGFYELGRTTARGERFEQSSQCIGPLPASLSPRGH